MMTIFTRQLLSLLLSFLLAVQSCRPPRQRVELQDSAEAMRSSSNISQSAGQLSVKATAALAGVTTFFVIKKPKAALLDDVDTTILITSLVGGIGALAAGAMVSKMGKVE